MTQSFNLLALSGALRHGATNTLLLRAAAAHYPKAALTLADLNLPLYDGDTEAAGFPAAVQTLHAQIAAADAVIIATPEYNGALSGVLKNALDWVSRIKPHPWADKPVAIMSAAGGQYGGLRAQDTLRAAMAPFQARLIDGPVVALGESYKHFNDQGALTHVETQAKLGALMAALRDATQPAALAA